MARQNKPTHSRRFSTQGESLYALLEVEKGVSQDDLRKAYRRMAVRYHPDKNPGDQTSADRFIEVSNAFAVLRDVEKRQLYDDYGSLGLQMASQFGADWVRKYMKKGASGKTKCLIILFGILTCGYCFCCCCMFCCGRCEPGVSQDDIDYQENVLRREINEERNRYMAKERERQQQMSANREPEATVPGARRTSVQSPPPKNATKTANASASDVRLSRESGNPAFCLSDEVAATVVPGAPFDPSSPFGIAVAQRVAQQRRNSRDSAAEAAAAATSSQTQARRASFDSKSAVVAVTVQPRSSAGTLRNPTRNSASTSVNATANASRVNNRR